MFGFIDCPEVNKNFKSRLHLASKLLFLRGFKGVDKIWYNIERNWDTSATLIFSLVVIFDTETRLQGS